MDMILLALVAGFVFIYRLWSGSLSSWDEAFYAHISRTLAEAGSPAGFIWGEATWMDKPLLYMWATALLYKAFGINEFTTRLFSALCGTGVVITAYVFCLRAYSRTTGVIAALMLVGTYHFAWFSRMGTLDVAFTLFVFLSVYSFLKAEDEHRNMVWCWLWFALAFLTKGVGAFLIPVILGLYVLALGRWGQVLNRQSALGAALFLALAGGWYYQRYLLHGSEVIRDGFFQHLVRRTTQSLDGHTGGPLTYVNAILYKGKPWGAVALAVMPFFIYRSFKGRNAAGCLLVSWVVVTVALFTAFKTKLHWYIMPVYPALAIMGAWGMEKVLRRYAVVVTAVVSLASVLYFGANKGLFTLDYNPEVKEFSRDVRRLSGDGEVYVYGLGDPGARFYFGSFSRNAHGEKELRGLLSRSGIMVVGQSADIKELDGEGELITSRDTNYAALKVR